MVAVAGLAVVAACGSDTSSNDSDVFSVVVTTSVHGDIVRSALDETIPELISIDVIMPPGADPHDFSASAKQAEQMENADLLVMNGLDLEAGLDGIIDAVADTGTPIFKFSDHIAPLEARGDDHDDHDDETHDDHDGEDHGDEDHGDDHAGEDHDDHHDHGGNDPHVWTDPVGLIPVVEALRDNLVSAGIDADSVSDPVAEYIAQLEAVDATIEETLASIPEEQRVLVTNHDAFGYFAARYDFEIIGTVIPSLTTNAEVSPAALDDLAAAMKERSVQAVFAENTESDRLASALADEVGNDVSVIELFSGSLGPDGSGAETYLSMMTTNAALIAEALSP